MKKIMKKVKGKKVLSFVLAAVMLATTFNMALPMLKLDASAAVTINGITQERVVGPDGSYVDTYESYAESFLNGAGEPTNLVIPGLAIGTNDANTAYDDNDWVVQGLSYYPNKDWIMVSVYHNDGALPSMIFALDAKSGEFVQAFAIKNRDANGNIVNNMDHGGGLAFSEYNFYYSGDDSDKEKEDAIADDADQIAYAPLSYFDNPQNYDSDAFVDVIIEGAVDLPEMGDAATAYVCYDNGIIWAGNFYEDSTGANDYKSPVIPADSANGIALQNSMIYGYKLHGGSSKEEWEYLSGIKGNTSDRAGKPTHCIAVSTDYEDIQYAIVDNGKVYISRSWGTGKNDEWIATNLIGGLIASLDDYSTLTVGTIDLSVDGTEPIQYASYDGTVVKTKAHKLDSTNTKHFDMMPMSEGLCFIDDDLYISFEGASNKYMNEYKWEFTGDALTKTGNCDYPIDVVWHVDPYKLMEEERKETKDAIYFEKVTQLEDIKDDEEYIIVYESPEKNPVNQKNILYAFDAYGNFKDLKLSKSTDTKINGYDGMIGHQISEYSVETVDNEERLYLTNPEKDDLLSMRWNIIGANTAKPRIQSPLPYYSSNRNFYFNNDKICMTNDTGISNDPIILEEADTAGNFYLKNDNSYIWCNDFSVDGYEGKVNTWYGQNSSTTMYADLEEVKGTFHTDALNKAQNIIGASIDTAENDYLRQISIYKCVTDAYSSTEKNRVYTDMNAELQADGTYTVNLETYATGALHYKASEVEKPTDFIFVLDESQSMDTDGATGMIAYPDSELSSYSVAGEKDNSIAHENGAFGTGDIYINIEGEYINLKVESSATFKTGNWDGIQQESGQYFWLFGTYKGETWYWWPNDVNSADIAYDGEWKPERPTEAQTMYRAGGNTDKRASAAIYKGTHYRYTNINYYDHYDEKNGSLYVTMRESAANIIDEVVADAKTTGLAHRFAVTQYGGTNGFYPSGSSSINTGTDYSNAFWSANDATQVENLKTTIKNIKPSDQVSRTNGDEFKYANGIIDYNNGLYTSVNETGRNVAVIFISDGIAGQETAAVAGTECGGEGGTEFSAGGKVAEANNVITQAKELKEKGAFIYTILVGHGSPAENYEKDVYNKAVSSQYPEASAWDNLGGECTELVTYTIDLSQSTSRQYVTYVDKLVKDIKTNDSVGVEKLADQTLIVEQLSDAFIVPENYDYTVALYTGYYDCLNRFQFKETGPDATGITATVKGEGTDKRIEVTGYNYSERYIARGHDGAKLKVSISGLIANANANITNTSINNVEKTAIYKTADSAEPFKQFPTEYFSIPEYTYVMDYGQKMLDTDINGTLCSVSDLPSQQSTYKTKSENGVLEITKDKLDLYYSMKLDAHANGKEPNGSTDYSGYSLIKRDDGTYDWFKIKLVPASNVLYEEDVLTIADDGAAYHWDTVGTSSVPTQDLSTSDDVYGFDNHYASSSEFSNGTHYYTTVDSSNKNSDVASFEFTGTGFDLISACGPNTGVQMVVVKQGDATVKAYIVDTYYDDVEGGFALLGTNDLLYQVPIVNFSSSYGTYTVQTKAFYISGAGAIKNKTATKSNLIDTGLAINSSDFTGGSAEIEAILAEEGISAKDVELIWFDDNSVLNGGTGVTPTKNGSRADFGANVTLDNYIDGLRIYNPLDKDSSDYIKTEKNVRYGTVIDNLADSTVSGGVTGFNEGIAFITGTPIIKDDEGNPIQTTLTLSNYESVGPTNELYLKGNMTGDDQYLTFPLTLRKNERVMLSLRAVNGPTKIDVTSVTADGTSVGTKIEGVEINSATEMYYDITKTLPASVIEDGGSVFITIKNTGSGVLAVNTLKLSGAESENTLLPVPRSVTRTTTTTQTTEIASTNLFIVTKDDLVKIEQSLAQIGVPGVVDNGLVMPIVEDEEIPDADEPTTPDADDDNIDSGDNEDLTITSLFELLVSFIGKLIEKLFSASNMF